MTDWQNLPSDLQSLMEKRIEDRRRAELGLAPDEDRRSSDRRLEEAAEAEAKRANPPTNSE